MVVLKIGITLLTLGFFGYMFSSFLRYVNDDYYRKWYDKLWFLSEITEPLSVVIIILGVALIAIGALIILWTY